MAFVISGEALAVLTRVAARHWAILGTKRSDLYLAKYVPKSRRRERGKEFDREWHALGRAIEALTGRDLPKIDESRFTQMWIPPRHWVDARKAFVSKPGGAVAHYDSAAVDVLRNELVEFICNPSEESAS